MDGQVDVCGCWNSSNQRLVDAQHLKCSVKCNASSRSDGWMDVDDAAKANDRRVSQDDDDDVLIAVKSP